MRVSGSIRGAILFVVCGIATGAAFLPGPFGWTLLVSLAGLVACIRGVGKTNAFFRGWLFGIIAWTVGLYWFPPVVAEYSAGMPGLRWIFFLLIVGYLGLELAIAAWLMRTLADALEGRGWTEAYALALASVPVWVCVDGYFPPLFPAPIGTIMLFHLPLAQSLDLFGSAGLAWIIALCNAGVFLPLAEAHAPMRRRWSPLVAVVMLLLLNEAYGLARIKSTDAAARASIERKETVEVALVQASVPFGRRRTGQFIEDNIEIYRGLTREAVSAGPLDLVVWPQNTYERRIAVAADGSMTIDGESARQVLARDIPAGIPALLTTLADVEGGGTRYLSILRGKNGAIAGKSYKRFPTPLSEYFPLGTVFPFLYRLTPRMNRIEPGPQEPVALNGASLGVYVCYDGMKPDSARALVRAGAEILVNPSSDQWSRDRSIQPLQAFAVTRLRAIETRRYLLRSTPNGMSTVVDATGRLLEELPIGGKGVLRVSVPRLQSSTPAAYFGPALYRFALVFLVLLFIFGRLGRDR